MFLILNKVTTRIIQIRSVTSGIRARLSENGKSNIIIFIIQVQIGKMFSNKNVLSWMVCDITLLNVVLR